MPVDFFEEDVKSAQQRFNQTFGELTTCNIRLRQSAILKICGLGCLRNKIVKAADKDQVREEICSFKKIRKTLNNVFNTIEDFQKQRRGFDNEKNISKKRGIFLR